MQNNLAFSCRSKILCSVCFNWAIDLLILHFLLLTCQSIELSNEKSTLHQAERRLLFYRDIPGSYHYLLSVRLSRTGMRVKTRS